ncbi:protein FAR1-RELATED SEQUENCE 5-like [Hevea brasiliensis]|uniref:protein FAR1-RELATED SEQUENCE 5-like n=1 Tax=Hevea brasiliensis TaxID=3981 RepID=UPI0025EF1589|nr:protein FAR1-RELATED SEQUENCE 5-like [Hevea brasiliensis]
MDYLVNLYKYHANLKGFSIVIRFSSKGNGSVHKYMLLTCDKGSKPHGGKSNKRVNCLMRINAFLKDNSLWVVGRVITDHIHQLDPSMSRFMTRHKGLSNVMKRLLKANDIIGIRPSKSIRLLEVQFRGPEKMGCLPKECMNFINSRRRLGLDDGDAESIQKLFYGLQAYKYVMDSFASLCPIAHEDVETFKWVFSTWLSIMGDIHLHAILTDQCVSIKATIREVMPETRHRSCLWHILSKLSEKFKGVEDFTKATNEFKALIFNSLTIKMFETNWNDFLTKHRLENNEWLIKLYFERENWELLYLKCMFFAGMISTQRVRAFVLTLMVTLTQEAR